MPTATYEDARRRTQTLTSAIRQHALPAAQGVDEGRKRENERVLKLDRPMEALLVTLPARLSELEAAESALIREGSEDAEAMEARDAEAERVRGHLMEMREAAGSAWGEAALPRLGLDGRTPQTHSRLLTFARNALASTDPMPELPEPRSAWNAPDLAAARAHLVRLVDAYEARLGQRESEDRQTQAARAARDAALEAWSREAVLASALARAALTHAGQDHLAARVLSDQDGGGGEASDPAPGGEAPGQEG